ncbi:MAG: hypothetical protein IAX21_04700 [Candidatus Bathyarchaeota archaeon]|nr:hypothetical protein [Candidatus Bathyarchaeum tardum]WGM89750.1 MAG: hypothetical protein NUK63_01085 [Candidatus Bathyarchaeum tardum]WNZ30155.1 MAG: hypothetical protein IAX21_04700 [Candidatus Bathyarchaeota archaeon]
MKRTLEFWLSFVILIFVVVFSVVAYVSWFELLFFVGSLFFVHWIGLGATIFIAVFVPIYYVLKRNKPRKIKTLLRIHVFGNLLGFLLVSVHFSQNVGRLAGFYPRLSDGFVLFLVMAVIVATGMIERFDGKPKLAKYTKPIHRYTVAVFYLVVIVHTLQGFNLI